MQHHGRNVFKRKDPEKKEWYSKHLVLKTDKYGTSFERRQADDEEKGFTARSPFSEDSKYMEPYKKYFMIKFAK